MNEQTAPKNRKKDADGETTGPVEVIRQGAIAASIWKRQSPSGYIYYDYTINRSWKSMSSEKTGYSRNFSERNRVNLIEVIDKATTWITERRASENPGEAECLAA